MNSTEKGSEFERRSLQMIQKALENGVFGVMKDCVKILPGMEYYSARRKANIKFDLALEVWQPEAPRFTYVYIVECKNYKGSIPVNDIEEFSAKISQVTGHNVKGIFVTNSKLQLAAKNLAESLGLMVINLDDKDEFGFCRINYFALANSVLLIYFQSS